MTADGNPDPLRILVVEDYPDTAETLELLLGLWGHDVRVARDGLAALEAAASFRPDAALIDLGLPRLSGYDVARRLRWTPGQERVFLIATTGYGQERDVRRCQEAGFDLHLTKPCDPEQLRAVLAACGPRAGRHAPAGPGQPVA